MHIKTKPNQTFLLCVNPHSPNLDDRFGSLLILLDEVLKAKVCDIPATLPGSPGGWTPGWTLGWTRLGALMLLPKMLVAVYGHAAVKDFDAGFENGKDRKYYSNAIFPFGKGQNWAIGSSWQCGFLGAGWYMLVYGALVAWPGCWLVRKLTPTGMLASVDGLRSGAGSPGGTCVSSEWRTIPAWSGHVTRSVHGVSVTIA